MTALLPSQAQAVCITLCIRNAETTSLRCISLQPHNWSACVKDGTKEMPAHSGLKTVMGLFVDVEDVVIGCAGPTAWQVSYLPFFSSPCTRCRAAPSSPSGCQEPRLSLLCSLLRMKATSCPCHCSVGSLPFSEDPLEECACCIHQAVCKLFKMAFWTEDVLVMDLGLQE